MMIRGVACEPSVDVFQSSDNERHILELSWWPRDDALAEKTGPLLVSRLDLHWDETAQIRDTLTEALARVEKRTTAGEDVRKGKR